MLEGIQHHFVISNLLLGIVFFSLTWILLSQYIKIAKLKSWFLDLPNNRSLHDEPTVRGGGIIFVILWSIFAGYFAEARYSYWLIGLLLAAAGIGFADDFRCISVKLRLLVQFIIAFLFLWFVIGKEHSLQLTSHYVIEGSVWSFPVLSICIVGTINLFNFMDGIDGFLTTGSIFILALIGLVFSYLAVQFEAKIVVMFLPMLLGFLVLNWPKAKVFMGDVGSYFIGGLVISCTLIASMKYEVSTIPWFIMVGPFIFDSAVTKFRRMLHVKRWYDPNNSFAFHRLKKSGCTVSYILYRFIALNIVLFSLALLAYFKPEYELILLGLTAIILLGIYLYIEKKYPFVKSL